MASEEQVADLLRLMKLVSSILRSHYDAQNSRSPANLLSLLMKDRYVECLVEFYARYKIEDRRMR